MRRQSVLVGLLLLFACGDPKASRDGTGAAREDEPAAGSEKIDCAVNGAAAFERVCTVDRLSGPDGLVLTIRHPSGSFRRFEVTKDGRGVVAADGSEPAAVTILDDKHIEVAVGTDRYRLPATVRK